MWSTLLVSLALGAEPSSRAELAQAVKLYFDGGRSAAAVVFEGLYAERPYDDDVAWWVARARIDLGHPDTALDVLEGREGRNQPTWRFQVLEATAHAVLGRPDTALFLLDVAWPQVQGTSDRPGVAAARGLLLAEVGRDAEAAVALSLAGPDPRLVLDPVLVAVLTEAVAFEVRGTHSGQIDVTRADGTWRVALDTGLARRGPQEDPVGPAAWRGTTSPRGRADPCPGPGQGWVWTSPAESLGGGQPGVFRARSGSVERLAMTPPAAVDLSPACLGGQVWFVRRLGDHAEVLRLDGQALASVPVTGGAVATVDARRSRTGGTELLLGLVEDGVPGVYWIPPDETEARPLLVTDRPLLAPRWVD